MEMWRFGASDLATQASDLWRSHFARHVVEMFILMFIGMIVGVNLYALALGLSTDEARVQQPITYQTVMGVAMSVPMAAWMFVRGHSLRSATEMGAVMLAPLPVLVACHLAGFLGASALGLYMPLSTLAMVGLIIYRRDQYRAAAHAHARMPGVTSEVPK
jgi:hypothetical protein